MKTLFVGLIYLENVEILRLRYIQFINTKSFPNLLSTFINDVYTIFKHLLFMVETVFAQW